MMIETALVALFVAAGTAQNLSELPDCAVSCFKGQVKPSPCKTIEEFECLCDSEEYISNVIDCVVDACDFSDSLSARTWAEDTCEDLGVSI